MWRTAIVLTCLACSAVSPLTRSYIPLLARKRLIFRSPRCWKKGRRPAGPGPVVLGCGIRIQVVDCGIRVEDITGFGYTVWQRPAAVLLCPKHV